MALNYFIDVGQRRLRCGYTTGTCAAAAAKGAAAALLLGQRSACAEIMTPAGIPVSVELLDWSAGPDWVRCAVCKDGGDDPDVTHAAKIVASVRKTAGGGVCVDGGPGVGRVTMPGLDQPVGAAAINSTPRRMIAEAVEEVLRESGASCGLSVVISVPDGEALAAQTFNPRLGIVGGISILGTGGIVRPMSEAALIDSCKLEIGQVWAKGGRDLLLTPGNYGERFSREVLGLELSRWALCSNYVGEAIDHAVGLGFSSILLVGHLGKLAKVAGGAMNTHSNAADGRRETLCAHAALCGADRGVVRDLFAAATTDAAVEILDRAGLRGAVMSSLGQALGERLAHRAGKVPIQALFFSNQYGILGTTPGAETLLAIHRAKE